MELTVFSNPVEGRWSSREFQKKFAKFVYRKGIDLHTIKSNDFREVVQFIDGHEAYATPNSNDLNGWILEEVQEEIDGYIKDVKASWKDTGCSIVLDGWEDRTGSHIINVLVSSTKGTIYVTSIYHNDNDALRTLLEQILVDIGVDNIVQIISHSASQMMKELGKSFEDKYQTVFWTVSGSHCIELLLKEIEKMDLVADVMEKAKLITRFIHGNGSVLKLIKENVSMDGLVKPSIIRSTVPYLTLKNMDNLRPNLDWWLKYGEDYPELQQFAIRVLSQTCDGASKFCLEKKMAEKLFYVKRNDTDQERHRLLASIHYNLCLQNFERAAAKEISIYDMDGIQDWTLDEALHPTTSSSLALVTSMDMDWAKDNAGATE